MTNEDRQKAWNWFGTIIFWLTVFGLAYCVVPSLMVLWVRGTLILICALLATLLTCVAYLLALVFNADE